jgi:DNA-3-methyladenine glycosylase I
VPVAEVRRCAWATKPATIAYHDREWGVATHDDRALFEYLVLEGAQAGLSWETILAKRERYREVFANFDRAVVARFGERDVARLVNDAGIVRHRGKIESAIANAGAAGEVARDYGSFDAYVWSFVDGVPHVNSPRVQSDVPATTPLADRFSRDLRARGFSFVGPTIVYAFMQAAGLVDDHLTTCFRSVSRRRK